MHPLQLALQSRLPLQRRHPRILRLCLEQAPRPALDHHVRRASRLGPPVLKSAGDTIDVGAPPEDVGGAAMKKHRAAGRRRGPFRREDRFFPLAPVGGWQMARYSSSSSAFSCAMQSRIRRRSREIARAFPPPCSSSSSSSPARSGFSFLIASRTSGPRSRAARNRTRAPRPLPLPPLRATRSVSAGRCFLSLFDPCA
jgi:hypothetical protein